MHVSVVKESTICYTFYNACLAFCRDNMLRFIEKCLLVYMQLRGNVYNYYVQFYQSKSTVDNRLNKID